MKKIKRILTTLVLVLCCSIFTFAGCSSELTDTQVKNIFENANALIDEAGTLIEQSKEDKGNIESLTYEEAIRYTRGIFYQLLSNQNGDLNNLKMKVKFQDIENGSDILATQEAEADYIFDETSGIYYHYDVKCNLSQPNSEVTLYDNGDEFIYLYYDKYNNTKKYDNLDSSQVGEATGLGSTIPGFFGSLYNEFTSILEFTDSNSENYNKTAVINYSTNKETSVSSFDCYYFLTEIADFYQPEGIHIEIKDNKIIRIYYSDIILAAGNSYRTTDVSIEYGTAIKTNTPTTAGYTFDDTLFS